MTSQIQQSAQLKLQGNELFRSNKLEQAIVKYTEAIALTPSNEKLLSNRALCHQKLNRPNEALADLETAAKLNPKWFKPIYISGQIYAKMDQTTKAIASYEHAIQLCKSDDSIPTKVQRTLSEALRKIKQRQCHDADIDVPVTIDANVCQMCAKNLHESKCIQCKKQICAECGIKDPEVIESQASVICRGCIPMECSATLIDASQWEEAIEYCEGCNEPFCSASKSPNCVQQVYNQHDEETGIYLCRQCFQRPGARLTDVQTLDRYDQYLQANNLEPQPGDFEKWIETQAKNDPSIAYEKIEPLDTDPGIKISPSKYTKAQVREDFLQSPSFMARETLLRCQRDARCMGNGVVPLRCASCHSADKERYSMLKTHFITFECIDCAVENAFGKH